MAETGGRIKKKKLTRPIDSCEVHDTSSGHKQHDVKLEIPMFLYKKGIKYTQIMHVFLSVILNNAQTTLGRNTTYRQVKSNL